jgi:hypothetical protein
MIGITHGITSVSAGHDRLAGPDWEVPHALSRTPTGARVTVEFSRETSLLPGQVVCVRYAFAGDGRLREGVGIATATRTVVRSRRIVVYHYRMSYWIPRSALMTFVADVAHGLAEQGHARGEPGWSPDPARQARLSLVAGVTAAGPSPA